MSTAGDGIDEAQTSLLEGFIPGSVDFRGRPSFRAKSGCWKSASVIVVVEMLERISYYGISSNMVSYLTAALGQSTAAAAANLNAWYGTAAVTPILGAFLADSFLGRFWTVAFSSLLYILGLGFLTLSAALNSFNSSSCKSDANNLSCSPSLPQRVFFFFSLYIVALAQGGHKPCLQAFGADQFDVEDGKELQAQSSFFNWFSWFPCVGILLVLLVLNYIQENLSWELGFGIPAVVMCFALVAFLVGTMTYRFNRDRDGKFLFARISQNFVSAVRNWQPALVSVSTEQEVQQILPQQYTSDNSLMESKNVLGNVIKEGKKIRKLVPIWCMSLGYSIVYAQPSTLFTKQGATLDRHIGSNLQVPAASLQLWIIISIMITVPIYDRILVPVIRAATKKPLGLSMLQRIGIGLCLSLISIMFAAIVESKRLATAREHGLVDMPEVMIPMSVWWLAPQYVLSGIANVFTCIGLQQFFYGQVPAELRSIGIALYLSILGMGSFLSSFLVYVFDKATRGSNGEDGWFSDNLNRAHLDYFYWVLAGLCAVSLAFYVYFAKSYVYNNRRIHI